MPFGGTGCDLLFDAKDAVVFSSRDGLIVWGGSTPSLPELVESGDFTGSISGGICRVVTICETDFEKNFSSFYGLF